MKLFSNTIFISGMLLLSSTTGAELAAQSGGAAAARGPVAANFAALSARADGARDADHLEEAAKLYRRALKLKPDWKEGWWSLGTIDYDSARYAEAMVDFDRLLKLAPTDGTTNLMLGLSEYETGLYESSDRHLAAAWKLGIQDAQELEPELLYHRVLIKLRARQFEGAYEILAHMLRMGMRTEKVMVATGMAVLRMSPVELPPAGSPGYEMVRRVGIAESARYTDTYERARELYQELIRSAPDFPNLHYAYGRFLMDINAPDAAATEFEAELKLEPKNYNAMLKLALLDYHQDSAAGIPYVEAALKIVPNDPLAHYLLGILSLDVGNVDRAIHELELARKMVPKEPQFAYSLANAYVKAHRNQDALRERQAFVALKAAQKADDSQSSDEMKGKSVPGAESQEGGAK